MFFFIDKPVKSRSYKIYRYPKNKRSRKTSPAPQLGANHSKKPISGEISSPLYKLFQPHKLKTKECFNLYRAKDPFLEAIRFLFFQTVQKMHRGTDFQIFDLFFPTKEPFQLSKTSLTVLGKTQGIPTKERMISHKGLTIEQ